MHRWWKNADIIQTISENFVPLAIDTRYTVDGRFVATEGEIYEFLSSAGLGSNDSLVCVTASGKQLAKAINGGGEILKGLEEWAQLAEEERAAGAFKVDPAVPMPIRVKKGEVPQGLPRPPVGGLILKSYLRALARGEAGNYERDAFPFGDDRPVFEPQPDFFWMSRFEWQSLVPARTKKGTKFAVPDTITVRLACCHLLDFSKRAWHPSEVRSGELTLTVEEVSPAEVCMRLEGFTQIEGAARPVQGDKLAGEAKSGFDARWLGSLKYDLKKKVFTHFDLVAIGDCWDEGADTEQGSKWMRPGRNPVGVAFELAGNSPAERVPPRALTPYSGNYGHYYVTHQIPKE